MVLLLWIASAYLIMSNDGTDGRGMPAAVASFFEDIMTENSRSWFIWSIFPFLCAVVGFWLTAVVSSMFTSWYGSSIQIHYGNKTRISRQKEANAPLKSQVFVSIFVTVILQAINASVGKFILPPIIGVVHDEVEMLPKFNKFLIDFFSMLLMFDFIFYWQHRLSHTVTILWNSHKIHHENHTPIGLSTAYIDFVDQGLAAICFYLSAFIIKPHPVTYSLSVAGILSELVAVHSGIDSTLFNFLTLRFLPGRSSVHLHDHHHMYSDRQTGAKNFAQFFWIWDYTFGTYTESFTIKK